MNSENLKTRTWTEISRSAILNNHKNVKSLLPAGTEIYAVIKADAYGHGAVEIASLLSDECDGFCVASSFEALELRRAGIENDILILGLTPAEEFGELSEYGIMPTVCDYETAKKLNECGKASCWIAVDTGMSRIGLSCDDSGIETVEKIASLDNITICGLFSHYARADEFDKTSTNRQTELFTAFADKLRKRKINFGKLSIANSAAITDIEPVSDVVREGIILYGVYPSDEVRKGRIKLEPALSLRTRIEWIKILPKGVGISYGHKYVTEKETRVATLCCGYADGVPRLLSCNGDVIINGNRAPILGRICMDQMMVDVSRIECDVDDIATVIGKDGDEEITVDEVAAHSMTIPYEILTSLSKPRVPKIYTE